MIDKNGNILKNGNKVKVHFYSFSGRIYSCEGIVRNKEFVEITNGYVPLSNDYIFKDIYKITDKER